MSFITVTTDLDQAVAALRDRVAGDVLVRDEPGYDAACAAWNLCFTHHPALVVIAASTDDVVEAVRFAHAASWPVTIQATGHGFSRAANDGLLIVLSRLTDVHVDAVSRTARIAGGTKWGAVLAAAQQHGLAPLLGSSGDVGAVGYTLGGGLGWLGRRYGLASDSVRSFELVLPDGSEVVASADEQPELFWALQGGGAGTLGVVTAMTVELYPVTDVYAGNLLYPVAMAGDVIRRYRSWIAGADERLTSSVVIMNFPPLDVVPEPLRGQSFVIVRGCWSGDLAEGAALIDEWRAWQAPVLDMFGPMPFSAADTISNDPVDPMPAQITTEWFDALPDAAIDVIVDAAGPQHDGMPMLLLAELRHAGGAIRRNAPAAANGRGRSGELLLEMVGPVFSPEQGAQLAAFLAGVRAELAPMVSGDVYLNFLEGEEKHERSGAAFSAEDLLRLGAVKAAVDPEQRFVGAITIPPTAS